MDGIELELHAASLGRTRGDTCMHPRHTMQVIGEPNPAGIGVKEKRVIDRKPRHRLQGVDPQCALQTDGRTDLGQRHPIIGRRLRT